MVTDLIHKTYESILKEELVCAMGCTEPIAIAYASAIVADALGGEPSEISASFSGNIIKNVKSVIVPATGGKHGIESAIAAGIIAKRPDLKLEVLCVLDGSASEKIDEYLARTSITIGQMGSSCTFDLAIEAKLLDSVATVRISGAHTNVTEVTLNGEDITARYSHSSECTDSEALADRSLLSVEGIVEYANNADLDTLRPILKRQIELNMAIANEGLTGDWGASIGKLILSFGDDVSRRARAYAAAGSDARMSGCELPVAIISGSGNQGITASVPVVIYANEIGADEDALLRALIVSDLVTIHQKTGIGTLSAYCGAISAGVGAGAGICYLMGGDFRLIAHTLVNAVAILSGTICDGAKPSCAAKIAMAVEAGIMGYAMARAGKQFYGGDGIVTKGVENTIRNVGRLAKDGMGETDREIINIMLGK
ncbi:MAG: serine dehydratase subunit alpha family protein [Clostridia bacterium]|nr:serine dehydratase subunit alpha family protein [Clostridia bacterium]